MNNLKKYILTLGFFLIGSFAFAQTSDSSPTYDTYIDSETLKIVYIPHGQDRMRACLIQKISNAMCDRLKIDKSQPPIQRPAVNKDEFEAEGKIYVNIKSGSHFTNLQNNPANERCIATSEDPEYCDPQLLLEVGNSQ